MKIRLLSLLLIPLFAGCLSPAPKAPTNWTIEFGRTDARAHFAPFGKSVRVSSVDVRPPYAGQRLAVLRPDGTIAFDSFNVFASSPGLLLRGAAIDEVEASGMFEIVLPAGSAAKAQYEMEIVVTQLALDCRTAGKRTASVALDLMLMQGREIVASRQGVGTEKAGDDFSAAYSAAFARAMSDALGKLKAK